MKKLINIKKRNDEKGLTLLEYAAGAGLILGIAVLVMGAFQNGMNTAFENLGEWIGNITSQSN